MNKYLYIWTVLQGCLWTYSLSGRILPASRLVTIANSSKPFSSFHYNPAVTDTQNENKLSLLNYSGEKTSTFETHDLNGTLLEHIENNDQFKSQGVGWSSSLGSGLYVAANYVVWESNQSNRTTNRNFDYPEKFNRTWASVKAAFDLADQVYGGFQMKYVSFEDIIIGSFNTRPDMTTRLAGDGVVTTVGVNAKFDNAGVAGSYQLPLRAKSEVYSEEKFVSMAGMRSISLSYGLEGWEVFLSQFNFEYKDGDRAEGTTVNDQNMTAISLFGLNRYFQRMFPLQIRELDIHYELNDQVYFGAGFGLWQIEYLVDSENTLPGDLEGDGVFFEASESHLFLEYQMENLIFVGGLRNKFDRISDIETGRRMVKYDGSSKAIFIGLETKI